MKRFEFLAIIFLFSIQALFAVDKVMVEIESGVTWYHNEAYQYSDSQDKDPDPILYRIGVSVPIYFSESFFIRPSLSVLSNYWQYSDENEWAMPVDGMFSDIAVLSVLLDCSAGYQLNFDSFSLGFFGGPAFNLRIPLWGEDSSEMEDMALYFFKEMNFINVDAGIFFIIPISKNIALSLKGDTWIPVHNLWSSSGLPFSDGLMVTVNAGIRINL
jgi:hypothetical protein